MVPRMTDAQSRAIEDLYLAFADAKRPVELDVSPCKDPHNFKALLELPLRKLSADDLWAYHMSAIWTIGNEADFCYYLPRMLELLVADFAGLDREVIFQKLPRVGWPGDWSERRLQAFQTYVEAVCQTWSAVDVPELNSWVCALSSCLPDMGARLDLLLTDSEAAGRNLLVLYEENSDSLQRGKLSNAYWETSSPGYTQVVAWFSRKDVLDHIQSLYGL